MMTKKEATEIAGTLGQPSKMPCHMIEIQKETMKMEITLEQVAKLMLDGRMRVEPVRHGRQSDGSGTIVAHLVSQADATQVPVILASLFVREGGKEEITVYEQGFDDELNMLTTIENQINAGYDQHE